MFKSLSCCNLIIFLELIIVNAYLHLTSFHLFIYCFNEIFSPSFLILPILKEHFYLIIIIIFNLNFHLIYIGDWGLGIGDWAQSPIPNPH